MFEKKVNNDEGNVQPDIQLLHMKPQDGKETRGRREGAGSSRVTERGGVGYFRYP